ncbi:unnamed protein product [Toxocara canis]|uniref:Uncharacterized protein n=1 Tax=Toxocara canis TaxID=6265 RepID=A0A3P7IL40_TOXCA|nr:unnamed protein product [Toxocara canis]
MKEKKDGKYLTSERKISENFNKGAKRELNADADGTKKANEANSVKAKKDNLRFVAATDSRIEVKEVLPEARSEVSCLEEKANDIERTDAVRYDQNIDEPVGRHVAAKRRRRCNGLIKMEASLDLDDPFQLHCQNSELNQTQKFARSDLTSFCFPSESPRSVLHRGPSRRPLRSLSSGRFANRLIAMNHFRPPIYDAEIIGSCERTAKVEWILAREPCFQDLSLKSSFLSLDLGPRKNRAELTGKRRRGPHQDLQNNTPTT